MPVNFLNPNNTPPCTARSSENQQGLQWNCPNLDATKISNAFLRYEQVWSWSQESGDPVDGLNGLDVTVAAASSPATGAVISFDFPTPAAAQPTGKFIAYWVGNYVDSEHTIAGGIIQREVFDN